MKEGDRREGGREGGKNGRWRMTTITVIPIHNTSIGNHMMIT